MAKRVISFVLLAIVGLWLCPGCSDDTAVTDYYHTYSDEAISFQYPDWPNQTPRMRVWLLRIQHREEGEAWQTQVRVDRVPPDSSLLPQEQRN